MYYPQDLLDAIWQAAGGRLGLSPFLRQTAKTQNSASGVEIPSKGGWSPGFISTAAYKGIQTGSDPVGDGGVGGRGGAGEGWVSGRLFLGRWHSSRACHRFSSRSAF
jgi:hypothetical protein